MRRLLSVFGVATLVWAAAATSVVASGPSADNAASPPGRILGIVPVLDQARGGARPQKSSNLSYHNGAVMHTNETFAIFWGPNDAAWDPGYQALIERFFADVHADSGASSNVYASDTQYYDTTNGNILYSSSFGGYFVDTTPYVNDCTDKATSICVSDGQLQTRIQADMQATGWSGAAPTGGPSQELFVFTPRGVGSCVQGSCSYTSFCAYHSWIGNGDSAIIYANQPYANQNYRIYTCNSGQWPNGNSADATLNVVSHEHNEAITDPQGGGWYDNQGYENGDKCAWKFGTASGPSGAMYNQTINGHHYYLQQEWSNQSSGCVLQGT